MPTRNKLYNLKILFIGNSFSEDANVYLYRLAKSVGADFEAFSLVIGGCSGRYDTFHLSLDYGRFAAACTRFRFLGLGDLDESTLLPDGENIGTEKVALIKRTVNAKVVSHP